MIYIVNKFVYNIMMYMNENEIRTIITIIGGSC